MNLYIRIPCNNSYCDHCGCSISETIKCFDNKVGVTKLPVHRRIASYIVTIRNMQFGCLSVFISIASINFIMRAHLPIS